MEVTAPPGLTIEEASPQAFDFTMVNSSPHDVYRVRVVHNIDRRENNTNPLIFYPPPVIPMLKAKEKITVPVIIGIINGNFLDKPK